MSSDATPNTSLYVKNINTKVKKPELRRQLYSLFGSYGKVLDVVATRADGMRGQAFVVFRDLQSAMTALRALEGFEFYEKPLVLEYARTRSKATIVAEHGEEALLRPDLVFKKADGTALPGRVTYSNAQGEAQGQDRKRVREDTASALEPSTTPAPLADAAMLQNEGRPAKTARTDASSSSESAVEEGDDDDDDGDSDDD